MKKEEEVTLLPLCHSPFDKPFYLPSMFIAASKPSCRRGTSDYRSKYLLFFYNIDSNGEKKVYRTTELRCAWLEGHRRSDGWTRKQK